MFADFAVAAGFISVTFFIYKWFELLILKKERLNIVQRLEGESLLEYARRIPIGLNKGEADVVASEQRVRPQHPQAKTLRWGMLLLGIGLGAVSSIFVVQDFDFASVESVYSGRYFLEFIIFAWCMCCGGLGLVIAFIVEHLLYKKEE